MIDDPADDRPAGRVLCPTETFHVGTLTPVLALPPDARDDASDDDTGRDGTSGRDT